MFLIVASSLIALFYVGRVVEVAYFRATSEASEKASDPPLNMLVPILVLAMATVYFGFFTDLSAGVASKAAQALVGGLK